MKYTKCDKFQIDKLLSKCSLNKQLTYKNLKFVIEILNITDFMNTNRFINFNH